MVSAPGGANGHDHMADAMILHKPLPVLRRQVFHRIDAHQLGGFSLIGDQVVHPFQQFFRKARIRKNRSLQFLSAIIAHFSWNFE